MNQLSLISVTRAFLILTVNTVIVIPLEISLIPKNISEIKTLIDLLTQHIPHWHHRFICLLENFKSQ